MKKLEMMWELEFFFRFDFSWKCFGVLKVLPISVFNAGEIHYKE
jgi:hypothetical protein